jgi:general secretion pathway protein G
MRRRRTRRSGFTLMEVLLVLAILVILGSMVGVFFAGMQKQGYEKAAKSQIQSFEKLLDLYRLDVGTYPTTNQGLQAVRTQPTDLSRPEKWKGPYAQKDIPLDPWGNPYRYEFTGGTMPRISSDGEDLQAGTEDDISNVN